MITSPNCAVLSNHTVTNLLFLPGRANSFIVVSSAGGGGRAFGDARRGGGGRQAQALSSLRRLPLTHSPWLFALALNTRLRHCSAGHQPRRLPFLRRNSTLRGRAANIAFMQANAARR